jgi:hypothetical protein
LLLPLKALIPEEVALLDYEATVHIMHVEDLTVRSPSPAGGRGRDQDAGSTEGAVSGGGGAGADPHGPLGPTRGAGVDPSRETPSHQWRWFRPPLWRRGAPLPVSWWGQWGSPLLPSK